MQRRHRNVAGTVLRRCCRCRCRCSYTLVVGDDTVAGVAPSTSRQLHLRYGRGQRFNRRFSFQQHSDDVVVDKRSCAEHLELGCT